MSPCPPTSRQERWQFRCIVAIVFLGFLGISIPYLLFPLLFFHPDYQILNLPPSHPLFAITLGATLAAYPLGQFVGSPIFGSLSDQYGRKQPLVWTLLGASLCYALTAWAIANYNLTLLIVGRLLAGMMEGNVAIARAMAAEMVTIPKYEALGKINATISSAYLIGPILGGLLSESHIMDTLSPSIPFYLVSLLFVGTMIVAQQCLPRGSRSYLTSSISWQERCFFIRRMLSVCRTYPTLKHFLISSTLIMLAVDMFYEFGPMYLTLNWQLSPLHLTVYNGVLCLGLVIGNGWVARFLSKKVTPIRALLSSSISLSALLLYIGCSHLLLVQKILFGIIGLVIGVANTSITVQISNAAPSSIQGEAMGFQLSLRVLGDAFICFMGSVLFAVEASFVLKCSSLVALTACYSLYRAHAKRG